MGGRMYLGNQLVTPSLIDLSLQFQDIQGDPYDNTALKSALDDKQDVLQSGTNIKTINNESLLGDGNISTKELPDQAGNNGKFLTTNGSSVSWLALSIPTKTSDLTNDSNYATITQVEGQVSTHNSSETAHSYIRGLISSETTNRQNADNDLQRQIDSISASSDVKDIVGTYAELEAYDTSTLGNNDIIKVLQDETQNDETTYYRWSTSTETFTLIGEEGPYYTKSAADSTFVPQTRTINNKALSSNISLSASDVGALPSSTVIPTVNDATITVTQGGVTKGSFSLNQSSAETIEVDSAPVYTAGNGIEIQNYEISVDSEQSSEVQTESCQEVESVQTRESSIDEILSLITGYDSTKTQTLKNINGTFTWVTD